MSIDAILRTVCDALRASHIPFMLTGSVAGAFHGASRATMDIDFVIEPTREQLEAFVSLIEAHDLYVSRDAAYQALDHRTMFNVIDPASGWKADLIVRKDRPFSRVELERRQATDFFGLPIHVATVEDVILSKLEWAKLGGSARQLEDVRTLFRLRSNDIDTNYIERWLDPLGIRTLWLSIVRTE